MRAACASLLALLVLAGCSHESGSEPRRTDTVLYTIGLSTDPYGHSDEQGFGVVTGLSSGKLKKVEVRGRGLGEFGGAEWLDAHRVLVHGPAPPLRRPLIYRYDGRLERDGTAPIPGGAAYAWSQSEKLFAYEPAVPCSPAQRSRYACYRASGELFVTRADGAKLRRITRGHLMGWTADGRVAFFRSYQRATPFAFGLTRNRAGPILPHWKIELPIWSFDRKFVAAIGSRGVVVARADGRIVQAIPSRLVISMIAWSPTADRLAFTTSGFPDPHQLFVVDRPAVEPRLLYATGAVHFDWITWSPDGQWLLLDEEHKDRWLLLRADRSGRRRPLPRLGGRPLWCCPENAFSAGGTVRNS
jgi:hypothetical protein